MEYLIFATLIILLTGISYLIYKTRNLHNDVRSLSNDDWKRRMEFDQIQSLFNIFNALEIPHMLPRFRDLWSISPDFGYLVTRNILDEKPDTVIEFGSGLTTLLVGLALKKNGTGKIVSIDQDEKYFDKTKRLISKFRLEDYVDLKLCSIETIHLHGKQRKWYATQFLDKIDTVQMIIVDGPPGSIQDKARYPALPVLYDKIDKHFICFVDDYNRTAEEQMVDDWMNMYPDISLEKINTETGAALIRR